MRLVAFSDVHGLWDKLPVPDGDVLIFAGDFMTTGYKYGEVFKFGQWLSGHRHKYKIWIAGNHDRLIEKWPQIMQGWFTGCTYLENHTTTVVPGLKIYGSPVTPFFNDWSFNVMPDKIEPYWDKIPTDTDVLITHGPALGTLDCFPRSSSESLDERDGSDHFHVGCPRLREAVLRIQPRVHIFGHVHAGYGHNRNQDIRTRSYNVSVCDEAYDLVHPCTVIDV